MTRQTYIQNLQNSQPLRIEDINYWLKENSTDFYKAIEKTECYKWTRWQRDNSIHVLPCCCPIRNDECIFIETYRELEKYIQAVRSEDFYMDLLEQYYKIQHNQNAVFEWLNHIEQYGKELCLIGPTIRIKITSHPRYGKDIQIDKSELPKLWEFKEIFQGHYYSDEYENYTNH